MRAPVVAIARGMRADGFPVSPGEAIDGARVAALLGPEDRDLLREGLEVALAKGAGARASFRRQFERVFAAPPPGKGGEPREQEGDGGGRGGEAEGSGRSLPQPEPEGGLRGAPRDNPPRQGMKPRGRVHPVRRRGDRDANRRSDERGDPARLDLASALTPGEEAAVMREAARRIAALRVAVSRRRVAAPRGSIDVQRALRANARWGGVPFALPRRAPRRRPPRLLLVLDVSHSVARAAGLLLVLVGALVDRVPGVRVLVFVDRLVDATDAWRRWLRERGAPAEEAAPAPRGGRPDPRRRGRPGLAVRPGPGARSFAALLTSVEGLHAGAPSDYGRMLYGLAELTRALRGRTVAWILGDGRTNRFDLCPWALEEAAGRLESVAWLVPEPPERWGTGDSALPAYAAHVDRLYAAHTLEALTSALHDTLRRLRVR